MKHKLKEYIDTVFADAERRSPRNERIAELKEEILCNLEDKYDDLIASGRTPAVAYNIAIAGVGDISELLDSIGGGTAQSAPRADTSGGARMETASSARSTKRPLTTEEREALERYRRRSAVITPLAIALYILCVIPCIITESVVGVILMFVIVAFATSLLIYNQMSRPRFGRGEESCDADDDDRDDEEDEDEEREHNSRRSRRSPVYRAISGALWCMMVCLYLAISFATGCWHLTWMIFLITTAMDNIIMAVFDLRR